MVYILPLVCFVGALIGATIAVRRGLFALVWALMALCALSFVWAIYMGRQLSGWDGIGYAIFAALVALPGLLGLVIGGLTGLYRRRKDRQKAGND